jgi:hypothetical protein
MSRSPERKRTKPAARKSAGDHPPPIAKPYPPGHIAESPVLKGIEAEAQKLLHEAGSPQLAKHAIDTAARRETIPDFREDTLAQNFGFKSREEMLSASKPITAPDGTAWWATRCPKDDRWSLWNEDFIDADNTYGSLEEARRHVYALA